MERGGGERVGRAPEEKGVEEEESEEDEQVAGAELEERNSISSHEEPAEGGTEMEEVVTAFESSGEDWRNDKTPNGDVWESRVGIHVEFTRTRCTGAASLC
jgi:hypothetical protein